MEKSCPETPYTHYVHYDRKPPISHCPPQRTQNHSSGHSGTDLPMIVTTSQTAWPMANNCQKSKPHPNVDTRTINKKECLGASLESAQVLSHLYKKCITLAMTACYTASFLSLRYEEANVDMIDNKRRKNMTPASTTFPKNLHPRIRPPNKTKIHAFSMIFPSFSFQTVPKNHPSFESSSTLPHFHLSHRHFIMAKLVSSTETLLIC